MRRIRTARLAWSCQDDLDQETAGYDGDARSHEIPPLHKLFSAARPYYPSLQRTVRVDLPRSRHTARSSLPISTSGIARGPGDGGTSRVESAPARSPDAASKRGARGTRPDLPGQLPFVGTSWRPTDPRSRDPSRDAAYTRVAVRSTTIRIRQSVLLTVAIDGN